MYKVLVVDDEENIREVIKEYAEFEGHEVDEACDGMQAVDMVREEHGRQKESRAQRKPSIRKQLAAGAPAARPPGPGRKVAEHEAR